VVLLAPVYSNYGFPQNQAIRQTQAELDAMVDSGVFRNANQLIYR
jgi:hypothetical protein